MEISCIILRILLSNNIIDEKIFKKRYKDYNEYCCLLVVMNNKRLYLYHIQKINLNLPNE